MKNPVNWFPIKNETLTQEIKTIGTKGFFILSYLMANSQFNNHYNSTIREIKEGLGIRDTRTVKLYMQKLINNKMIEVDYDIMDYTPNAPIVVKILYKENIFDNTKGYTKISTDIFFNLAKKLQDGGWALYCNLLYYNNMDFGYACPSYKTLQGNLGVSNVTITRYLNVLIENKMVKVEQDRKPYCEIINGKECWKFGNNKYIIKSL